MRRGNGITFGAQENEGSDQSISEEEEGSEGEWPANTISLGVSEINKGAVQILSKLDMLRESCELHSTEKEFISSHERTGGYHIDDEVEIPLFNDTNSSSHCRKFASANHTHLDVGMIYLPTMASISHSDEEIISDDEDINPFSRNARENVGGTWSEVSREAEALVLLTENPSWSSSHGAIVKENKSSKGTVSGGGRKRSKPKFSFGSHSCNKDLIIIDRHGKTPSDNIKSPGEIGAAVDEDMDEFMAESKLDIQNNKSEKPENHIVPFELANKHDLKEHSVADFLHCFQARSEMPEGNSKMEIKKRGRRAEMVSKRHTYSLGDRDLDDDDLPGTLDGIRPFPSDDEENPQVLKSIIPRSMADQLHETFGVVSVIDERPQEAFPQQFGTGLYGKLQLVMQSEKEVDTDHLKNISTETSFNDERMCISVKILSRSLEGKLIVCSCTSVGDGKNSCWEDNLKLRTKGVARTLTVIFNPRMCSDIELEVGNLTCIRPPWYEKKVHVMGEDEVIILCSYFAKITASR